MRLIDLTPSELAFLVDEAYLADQGEFNGSVTRDIDTLDQLRGYLGGKPALAGVVLDFWLAGITGEEALEMRQEAQGWFDLVILGPVRGN